jgi:aspartyl-tRNA(Asn)/glutamyl-tRNA(Gln) amidotransferase subunit C
MSGQINQAEVRRVAHLSRLKLTDDEVRLFSAQLGQILHYVEQLDELDAASLAPDPAQPAAHANAWRVDEPRPSIPLDEAMLNAPSTRGDLFTVPAVLDQSS